MTQRGIPCMFMRGGTSRGPFFELSDLPTDPEVRDRVLLAAMGSPDARQIDGLGGADMLTSKIAMIGPSARKGVDVDYLFAQVWLEQAIVDTTPSCGNMLAGVGPFAIERGLVTPTGDETRVAIHNVNTHSRIQAVIRTPGGEVAYDGEQRIDGVPGTAAPVLLHFTDVAGSKCGAALPTGSPREVICGVAVSCIDVAMPMVLVRARDLGISGYDPAAIAGDGGLLRRIEAIRLEAGRRMGLGDVTRTVIPKVGLIARPRRGGAIYSCYLTPHHVHAAHAVTGAICVASGCAMHGTVAATETVRAADSPGAVRIEHPSGSIDVRLETASGGADTRIVRAGVVRTARKIMDGQVFVPARLWP